MNIYFTTNFIDYFDKQIYLSTLIIFKYIKWIAINIKDKLD